MNGSCLCAKVRYRIQGEIKGINYCHCRQCRKASGSAFATNAAVDASAFTVRDEHGVLASHASSPGKRRYFCSSCGSPIYSASEAAPEVVYVRIGTIDDDDAALVPDIHIHVASKAPWFTIRDELPQRDAEEDLWF